MAEPHCGVKFCTGYYKFEVTIYSGYGERRNYVIECPDVTGLYPDKLIDRMVADIEAFRKTVQQQVEADKKRRETGGNDERY